MIVWSGWGIMVAIITVVAFVIGIMAGTATGLPYNLATGIGYLITGAIAGGGLFLLTRVIESKPGRVFIDEQTGQRIEVGNSAGSFFFIPTRLWTFIVPVLSLVLAGAMYFNPNPPRSELEAYDSMRPGAAANAGPEVIVPGANEVAALNALSREELEALKKSTPEKK